MIFCYLPLTSLIYTPVIEPEKKNEIIDIHLVKVFFAEYERNMGFIHNFKANMWVIEQVLAALYVPILFVGYHWINLCV